MDKDKVIKQLETQASSFAALLPGLKAKDLQYLDFSESSTFLQDVDLKNTSRFNQIIFDEVLKGKVGIGGFFEDRVIYKRSTHYDGEEPRSLHLGLDIWAKAGTALFNPLDGTVHSFQDNEGFGNYGPTLILKHQLENGKLYALYGHLDHKSIENCQAGDFIKSGELLGRIGDFPENGDWPPHLHWQLMTDMLGHVGDFPGVAEPSNRDFYLQYCIDPHYLLVIPE